MIISTIRDLRTLLSSFISDPENAEYLGLLRRWHAENARLEDLINRRRSLLEAQQHDSNYICAELEHAKALLLAGRTKEFRAAINLMESKSGHGGILPWKVLR